MSAPSATLPVDLPLPPAVPGAPVVGSFFTLWRRPLEALRDAQRELGDVVRFRAFHRWLYQFTAPEHVGHVLQDRAENYPKSPTYDDLAVVLGRGLLTSEGAFWKRQRRLAQPAFRREQLALFTQPMQAAAAAMHAGWRDGEPVEVSQASMRFALRVVGQALFSTDLGGEADALGPAVCAALTFANDRAFNPVKLPLGLPLPSHVRFNKTMRVLEAPLNAMIAARREAGVDGAPPDLLSRLVFARDPETGEGMTDQQLRDELMTFLLAGHETTAQALTMTLDLLAAHPEVDAALAADLSGDDLLDRVIREALRLYPPAWVIERISREDDAVGGFRIPARSMVMLPTWVVHRHPDLWTEPDRFDPERWSSERSRGRSRWAYFPFGGGQRQCIGEAFALQELRIALRELLGAWRFERQRGSAPELDALITLRPADGLALIPRRR